MDSPARLVKADIGPWKHEWPHNGTPGPSYEWRKKALRWWDHWLKGVANGVMEEPRFMVYVRDACPPDEEIKKAPGVVDYTISPPDRVIRLISTFTMTSDERTFTLTETRKLLENDEVVREKKWHDTYPRACH